MKRTILASTLLALSTFNAQAADITVAYDSDPVSLDPMQQLSASGILMGNMLFDPLVRYDSKYNIIPRIAESWEQLDDRTIRFHLRQGVKFHSGNPLTADDVIFSFNRARTAPNYKSITQPFESMKKVDDYTVDLTSKAPYPLALQMMTNIFIMDQKFYSGKDEQGRDKAALAAEGGSFAELNESGSGAFILKSRQQGNESVYVKNPDYWAKTGNVDTLRLVTIKENATRVNALLSGDVDWIYPVPPNDIKRLQDAKSLELYSIPSNRIIFLFMNGDVQPAFKDKRVREAFNLAINNEGIAKKIMNGNATAAGQNSPEGFSGHNPELLPRYDLEKAKALMKEAGYEDGFKISLISPNNRYVNDEKIAQAVAAMLAKINIKVDLVTMPKAQYWPERDKCEADIFLMGISPISTDSIDYSSYVTMTKDDEEGVGQYNCGYSDPELDDMVRQAQNEMDTDKRNQLMQDIATREYSEAAFIPLHWQNLNWAYKTSFTNFPDIVNMSNIPKWDSLIVKDEQ